MLKPSGVNEYFQQAFALPRHIHHGPHFVWDHCLKLDVGTSIKYVMLFLTNFDPLPPPVTLCHTSGNPQSTSHISEPPQNPDNCPASIYTLGLYKQRSIKLQ